MSRERSERKQIKASKHENEQKHQKTIATNAFYNPIDRSERIKIDIFIVTVYSLMVEKTI